MKKLMFAVLMALSASAAFAGDSNELKAIKKAKTYAEADALVKQSLGSLVNDDEKAAAYNHLTTLALKQYDEQQNVIITNQTMKENKPVDMEAMYEGAYNALLAAVECDKYDQLSAKPKKYGDKLKDRIWAARIALINAGQDASQNNKSEDVLRYFSAYLDTDNAPLFDSKVKEKEDEKKYIGQVAFWAAQTAYIGKKMDLAEKYADMAMADETQKKNALTIKLYAMKDGLKTHADSLAYIGKLKELFTKEKTNDVVVDNLNTMYSSMGMDKEQLAFLDEAIAANPNSFVALADKGLYYVSKNDPDNAIKSLKLAAEIHNDNAAVLYYLGVCYTAKAADMQDPNGRKITYQEAIKYLDKAKELDPEKKQVKWGYTRYQAYYNFYGANAPETKAAEEDSKN